MHQPLSTILKFVFQDGSNVLTSAAVKRIENLENEMLLIKARTEDILAVKEKAAVLQIQMELIQSLYRESL